jgi:hypothetical protein
MMACVKAPRNVFVNFPLGRQCGKPNEANLQTQILKDALRVLVTATTPGEIVDLPYEWHEPFDWASYSQDTEQMLKEEGEEKQEWKSKA